jgi:MOSC domain-containing protein YiiM
MHQGRLLAIAVRSHPRGAMLELPRAEITIHHGVHDDFRGKPGARQVTVLCKEAWDAACQVVGRELPWTVRRANLLIDGIVLAETTGHFLKIGTVVLQITGETDPCARMEEQVPGLRQALAPEWRGGVCCRVVQGGCVERRDLVTLGVEKRAG